MSDTQPASLRRKTRRAAAIESLRLGERLAVPAELPIAGMADVVRQAIDEHQVVIVAGETGSGKSTQLPKLCIAAGRGVDGLIGHTQPRRVAARSIAQRLAEETGTQLGGTIGYAVRFTDQVGDATVVKVMTDGILLAEIQRDRLLRRYDTLIIDEAHERSLNVDFLLGFLAQLLPQRRDLKVIVTSATIDTERFAEHFAPFAEGVAVVAVSGRSYPVEIRYRPYGEEPDDDRDQVGAVIEAIDELSREGRGDVLVFLSGEREIHDTADALRRLQLAHTEILPLYARLSSAEQQRIFQAHTGRRIVLSTNVAETSLTVPGVRYVVDAGTARISRYSARLKVQRLPIEPVSQASADQRAGRCGRVAPGICIRLYSADDYASRDEFTEPEILRTNLASVILQMTNAGLGRIEQFPFLDAPDARSIRNGYSLLDELGAIDEPVGAGPVRLTKLGRRIARLPIDPRMARMVIEAERLGCVREVLVIAAALSIQDPREVPADKRQSAEEAHRRHATEGSDFLAFLRLWDDLRHHQHELSNNQFRRHCRSQFLNYLRVREWQDLVRQLRSAAADIGIRAEPGSADAFHPDHVHRAVLSGLLAHIGLRDAERREYRGAHGSRFAVSRDSAVAKSQPRWLVAAELVETNRLWARGCAPIKPEWAERLGEHLAKYSYGEPRWEPNRGTAMVTERVSLFGLQIVVGRSIHLDRVDQAIAREMFIQHALVEGDADPAWLERQRFLADNAALLESLAERARRRRSAATVDPTAVAAFYAARLPPTATTTRHFDTWWKRTRPDRPELLTMTEADLGQVLVDDADQFPGTMHVADLDLPITYRFDPSAADDGATVHVPLTVLNRIPAAPLTWPVPGYRADAVLDALRSLPKSTRRQLNPMAAAAERVAEALQPVADVDFAAGIAAAVNGVTEARVRAAEVDLSAVAEHLRLNIAVVDDRGRVLGQGRHLADLRTRLAVDQRAAVARVSPIDERAGIVTWDVGTLPTEVTTVANGVEVIGYPALLDHGSSVALRIFTRADLQQRAMRGGVFRLLRLAVGTSPAAVARALSNQQRLAIAAAGFAVDDIAEDSIAAAVDAVLAERDLPWDAAAFADLVGEARAGVAGHAVRLAGKAADAAAQARRITRQLDGLVAEPVRPSADDIAEQLARLLRPGFVRAMGAQRLGDLNRYLRAIEIRLDKFREDLGRDRARLAEIRRLERRYVRLLDSLGRGPVPADVVDAGWMLEELRVATFAQSLGARSGASVSKLDRLLTELSAPR